MILRFVKYYFIYVVFIFLGCSGVRTASKIEAFSIKPLKLNAWVDLMPGRSPSFYMSGKLLLINNSPDSVKGINFENISVFQGSSKIYEFAPSVEFLNNKRTVISFDSIDVSFKNKKGLPAGSKIDLERNIDIFMTVSFNSVKKVFGFKNLKVEKVY